VQQAIAALGAFQAAWLQARWQGWVEAERGRFVPWLSVCMGAGVVAYFNLRAEPNAWAGAAAILSALLACIVGWRLPVARALGLAGLFAALGFLSGQAASWRALPIEPLPTRAVVLTGTVRGVDLLPEGRRVTLSDVRLEPDAPPLARLVRIRLHRLDTAAMGTGDRVRVRALIRPPSSPAFPGAWDLQRDAFFSGLGGSGYALNPSEVLERAPPRGGAATLQGVRDWIAGRAMAGLPGPAGAVAATLLTGTTTAIPPRDREAFRDAGLAHLLAVAGLHIGIVMGVAMGTTRLLLALSEHAALHWPTKALAAGAALVVGGAYLLLTGAHLPIIRSFAMACLVTLGLVLGRRALSLRGLALAATALMLLSPNEVVGASFGMSFSAVLALVAGYEALRPLLARLYGGGWGRRIVSHVVALVLTSLLAGTASAPFGAYHFGHFQLYFIVANVAAVPLTAFWVMPLGLAALLLMPLGLEPLALMPMGWGIDGILWIGRTVSTWPSATLAVPHMPAWGLCVFSLGLAWLGLWRSRLRLAGVPVMLAGLLSPLAAPTPDILVSAEARLIAIRTDRYYLMSQTGASKFVRDAWQNQIAAGPLVPVRTGEPAPCDADACRVQRGGHQALVLRSRARPDCAGIGLLVSAEPARGECPAGIPYVDRFSVWRDGAVAIWLTGAAPRILSDRAYRGDRPWVPGPPTPRRTVPNLPMATPDELPPAAAE
jgi:competence protein ComEC